MAVKPTSNTSKNKSLPAWAFFISELVSKFGVSGTVVIIILYVFVHEGTVEQHREFIDKFILLKFGQGQTFYLMFILLIVIILFISTRINYRRKIKLLEEQNSVLQKEKNTLQVKLLK